MTYPPVVTAYLAARGWGHISTAQPVSGGCINSGRILHTTGGPGVFFKHNSAAPADMFAREAEGLEALSVADGPRVPQPYLVGDEFLLLEYLPSAPPARDCWEIFGQRLAALHSITAPRFGFAHDNYIGLTPQSNTWTEDGCAFFAERRLLFQAELARKRGLLGTGTFKTVERLAARLPELVPVQPASLLHGDLWGGNVLTGPDGHTCLIDPAAHYGWAEADLAMTALFGRFPEAFYAAYAAARPLAPGYRGRFDLYNLYHLLNHANLFGVGYLDAVEAILREYA